MALLNEVNPFLLKDGREGLPVHTYEVDIAVFHPVIDVLLGKPEVERRTVKIQGYTLKDAKRRSGIQ